MKEQRVERIVDKMKVADFGQVLVSDPTSIFYLTGKWIHPGERLLVLVVRADKDPVLVVNKMFPVGDIGIETILIDDTDDGVQIVADQLDLDQKIGVDKNWPSHFLLRLLEIAPQAKVANGSVITDSVRAIKDEEELDLLRQASQDNDRAMAQMKELLSQGYTELEMRDKLAAIYKEMGNSGFSFEPIIAYGPNGADPHHETDGSTLQAGQSIVVDIGGIKNSYASDMTRTYFYKEVSDKHREIYEIVLEANRRAIELVKPGVKFSELDGAARDYITEKGYGEYFTHRLGHFIGIDCHEAGDVSGSNHQVAQPGMVFSIEPGIYISGEVGVRIEDLIVCTEDGYENLNSLSKELEIIE